jgi:hypothetical protein
MSKARKVVLNRKHPKIFYRVGAISLQWNTAEYWIELIICRYLWEVSHHVPTLLETWGNDTRAQILRGMVQTSEEPPEWREYYLELLTNFSICKANRNFVVHGLVRDMHDNHYVIGYSGDGGQAFHLKADSASGRSRTAFR